MHLAVVPVAAVGQGCRSFRLRSTAEAVARLQTVAVAAVVDVVLAAERVSWRNRKYLAESKEKQQERCLRTLLLPASQRSVGNNIFGCSHFCKCSRIVVAVVMVGEIWQIVAVAEDRQQSLP